MHRKILKIFIC